MHQIQSRPAVAVAAVVVVAAAAAAAAVVVVAVAAADRMHRIRFQLWRRWNQRHHRPRKQIERVVSQVGFDQTSLPLSLVASSIQTRQYQILLCSPSCDFVGNLET